MSPWILLTFDVIAACLAVGGITLIVRSLATRHLSFAARVAQGRVQEDTTPEITRWLRRMGASALDSLGSTSESVARRLALAGMAPEVGLFRLRQAAAGIAGLILSCLALTDPPLGDAGRERQVARGQGPPDKGDSADQEEGHEDVQGAQGPGVHSVPPRFLGSVLSLPRAFIAR